MARSKKKPVRLPDDPRAAAVVRTWLENGLSEGTARSYCCWVRAFLDDCKRRRRDPDAELTREAFDRFHRRYTRRRGIEGRQMSSALHAWSRGLRACGADVPLWVRPKEKPALPPLLSEFRDFVQTHRGVRPSTAGHMTERVQRFLEFLRSQHRSTRRPQLAGVDAYVLKLSAEGFARRTVAQRCVAIRAYLRFLHVTRRLSRDLAASVIAPRHRAGEQPPRALPWADVKAILRSVDRRTPAGQRDYAMLLTMASYGVGGAETRGILLEDVDWTAGLLRVRRPKTGQEILLPLLPGVARALAAYLRNGRPTHSPSRALFVQIQAPRATGYEGLSSSAVSKVVAKYARMAGVQTVGIGSHTLRHSHATRQIELGAPLKVVGDILGHRSPRTTSAYVRVALNQLRQVALPVPS